MLGQQQVRIRLPPPPSHPAAELIKFRQSEPVRPFDQDRVRIGDVQSRLDDGGADQDVGFPFDESAHHFFQIFFVHLSVTHGDAGVREQRPEPVRRLVDGLHPVVQKIDLAAALQFP